MVIILPFLFLNPSLLNNEQLEKSSALNTDVDKKGPWSQKN